MMYGVLKGQGARPSYPRGRGERGAALVEFAIILPLILLITFGIIEYSYAFNADSTVAQAARAGGRTASALSQDDTQAEQAAGAVGAALQTLPANEPQLVWIYKVTAPDGSPPDACATDCTSFTWDPVGKKFNTSAPGGSGWKGSSQNICTDGSGGSKPFDLVGVYVKIDHKFITPGLFGPGTFLTDHSVFRLEPKPSSSAICPPHS